MVRRLWTVGALLGLFVGTAVAQDSRTVDARAALQASLEAMGGTNLKTIQYSGSGWFSLIGQTYGLAEDWPRYEVPEYVRVIDYDATWSREDFTRRQGSYPTLGRTPMPEQRITAILGGTYAWDIRDKVLVPLTRLYLDGVSYSDLRRLELALTPHGALKAGLASSSATAITLPIVGPSDFGLSQFGRKVTIVSFSLFGGYKMNVTINDQNLVELVDTWFPNPIYGDMDYEMRYTQYKDFGGVKFPGLVHVHQGDPRLNPAHNYYELTITDVRPNVPASMTPVPDAVRQAAVPEANVDSQRLADGVWVLGGGTHNSLLADFRDFAAIVEAPNNEARSLAILAEANRLLPGKPIRYLVNTHHHMDHAGGLRTFLSQGTIIVTHESNKDYYMTIPFYPAPWTLKPDRMAMYNPMYMISRRPAPIETVGGDVRGTAQYVVTDGERMLQIFHVQDMAYELGDPSYRQGNHSADMLIAYLPKERILLNADLYSPPAPGATPPVPTPGMRTLQQNMLKLKLDPTQHVPVHGRVGTNEEFMRMFAKPDKTN
jgi:hypothetical protein